MVASEGFEPPKAMPADLQSDPFGHLGNSPDRLHPRDGQTQCTTKRPVEWATYLHTPATGSSLKLRQEALQRALSG